MVAHMTKIHEDQQKMKVVFGSATIESVAKEAIEKEANAIVQAEAFAKVVDDSVVDDTNVINETSEASKATMANEVEPLIPNLASIKTLLEIRAKMVLMSLLYIPQVLAPLLSIMHNLLPSLVIKFRI